MGTIENVVKLFTKQKCVYWEATGSDGKGGHTFAAPVEIDCRWDAKLEIKEDYDGNRFSSQAQVLVNIDIPRRSYLANYKLADLQDEVDDSANVGWDISNPRTIPYAFIVIQFEKIPMVFADDDFVRTAFLFDQG